MVECKNEEPTLIDCMEAIKRMERTNKIIDQIFRYASFFLIGFNLSLFLFR